MGCHQCYRLTSVNYKIFSFKSSVSLQTEVIKTGILRCIDLWYMQLLVLIQIDAIYSGHEVEA